MAVAELLGHKNGRLVMAVYGHLLPGREDHARRAIDDAFGMPATSIAEAATAQGRPE